MPFAKRTALLALLAVLLAACARATGPRTTTQTVRIDRGDADTTVQANVGDVVLLDLGASEDFRWKPTRYPHQMLSALSSDTAAGRFRFEVLAEGEGTILVVGFGRCGPPRPAVAGVGCPVTGDEPIDGIAGRFPRTIFRVTVQVT